MYTGLVSDIILISGGIRITQILGHSSGTSESTTILRFFCHFFMYPWPYLITIKKIEINPH